MSWKSFVRGFFAQILPLFFLLNIAAAPARAAEKDHTWSLSGTLKGASSEVIIAVTNSVNFDAATLELHYENTKVEYVTGSVITALGRATDMTFSPFQLAGWDYVRFVMIPSSMVATIEAGTGDIGKVVFRVKDGVAAGTWTTLLLTDKDSKDTLAINEFQIRAAVAPKFQTMATQAVNLGQTLSFQLKLTDSTLTGLTYSMLTSPGTGATLSGTQFSWRSFVAGSYSAKFMVTDGTLADTIVVNIKVNNKPVLTNPGNQSGTVNQGIAFTLQATDADNDPLRFSLAGSPGTGARVDSLTGRFSWVPALAGTFTAIFKVTDGVGSDSVTVEFIIASQNYPPYWPVQVDTLRLKEGEAFSYTFPAPIDENTGDIITASARYLPTNARFSAATYTFTWTPGFYDAGVYQFLFVAEDQAGAKGTKSITLIVQNVNQPPFIEVSQTVVDGKEGEFLSFVVSASDPDHDKVAVSAINLPQGATFTDPLFSWVSPVIGEHMVIFVAKDPDSLADSVSVLIRIASVNRPPLFTPLKGVSAEVGKAVTFKVVATDPNIDVLTYSILPTVTATGSKSILDRGATFSGQDFTWTPAAGDIGPNIVEFEVRDPGGLTDRMQVTITVAGGGITAPPQFSLFEKKEVEEGSTLVFKLPLIDSTLANLKFSATNLPVGAVFDSLKGILTWRPNYLQSQSTDYEIIFGVSDGNFQDLETLVITVKEHDLPPILSHIGNLSVNENDLLKVTLVAVDSSGEAVRFDASGLPVGALLYSKGLLTFRPGFSQAGVYPVTFFAIDASGNTDQEAVTLTVQDVNRKPTLVVDNQAVSENQLLDFTLAATDPDNDSLTFAAYNVPTGATFTVATGQFSWTPTQQQSGNYVVLFTASDGKTKGTDSVSVVISVGNVNRPPVIDPVSDQVVAEGATLSFQVIASDPDQANQVTVTAKGLPAGYQLIPSGTNPVTVTVQLTPTYTQQGVYEVTLTATDNDAQDPLSSSRRFKLEVLDVDVYPTFTGALAGTGDLQLSVNEGGSLELVVEAVDLGGDALSFSASGLPRRASAYFDTTPRKIIFSPDYDQAGSYQFEVVVTDGKNVVARTVKVAVSDVNRPPRVLQIGDQKVKEGNIITFAVNATDLDGDAFTVKTAGHVSFLTLGANPPARIRDGNVFIFDTALLPKDQQIASAVFVFWAEDTRHGISDTVSVEIAIERRDSTQVPGLTSGQNFDFFPPGHGFRTIFRNRGTGSFSGFQAHFLELSGFWGWLPRRTLLASAGEEEKGQRKGVYTYLAGDLTSQFYGIRRGWGLDLTSLQGVSGAAVTVTLNYFDEDLPTDIPNFSESRISVFGYDSLKAAWIKMDSVVVYPDSNKATFVATNFAITQYTLGALLDVVAPVISNLKVLGGTYTISSRGVDTLYNLSGDYEIKVNITDDEVISGSGTNAELYYAIGSGAFQEVFLNRSTGVNLFNYLIHAGAQQSGTVIRYYIKAKDSMNEVSSPQNAPAAVYELILLEPRFRRGDVNQDNKIDIFDLLEILKVLGGIKPVGITSDVNSDGKTDIFDLLALLRLLAG